MTKSSDDSVARIGRIAELIGEALAQADTAEEFMLGAKLSEALLCAQERLDTLSRRA